MDAEPTANSIMDHFVPKECLNDWQRWSISLLTAHDERPVFWIGNNAAQFAFSFDTWSCAGGHARCIVRCEVSTDREVLRVNDRANLTWAFLRILHHSHPSCPSFSRRLGVEFDNAATHDEEADFEIFIPALELPPMPPQLVLALGGG